MVAVTVLLSKYTILYGRVTTLVVTIQSVARRWTANSLIAIGIQGMHECMPWALFDKALMQQTCSILHKLVWGSIDGIFIGISHQLMLIQWGTLYPLDNVLVKKKLPYSIAGSIILSNPQNHIHTARLVYSSHDAICSGMLYNVLFLSIYTPLIIFSPILDQLSQL